MRAGDVVAAAGAAARVAMHLLFDTALMAPVRGWLTRAERLLEGQDETPVHAWVAVVRSYERLLVGDLPSAREWARRAIEIGSKRDPAAAAIGRVAEARSLILAGEVQQGLVLLDEAGVATVSGELDPLSTGVVYCELVCALQGARAIRSRRGMDGSHGAVAPGGRHRKRPRALPRPPRRDPQAAGVLRRGREGGARSPAKSCAPTFGASSGGR